MSRSWAARVPRSQSDLARPGRDAPACSVRPPVSLEVQIVILRADEGVVLVLGFTKAGTLFSSASSGVLSGVRLEVGGWRRRIHLRHQIGHVAMLRVRIPATARFSPGIAGLFAAGSIRPTSCQARVGWRSGLGARAALTCFLIYR